MKNELTQVAKATAEFLRNSPEMLAFEDWLMGKCNCFKCRIFNGLEKRIFKGKGLKIKFRKGL